MISAPDLSQAQLDSPLGRTSPVVKLAVAIAWLVALAFTLEPLPPVAVAVLALGAGMWLGQIPIPDLGRALAPLWLAALGIGLFNTLFSPANLDPAAVELITIGPFRITEPALLGGVSLALRVIAIATVGAVFALTTDSTKLVDSLVQQARVPERFAYGTLAAYQAIPRFAEDLTTLRQARRIRGLQWRLASAAARGPARARDPPRGPQGARDGRAGLRVGAALRVPGRGVGPVRRLDRARRPVRRLGGAGDRSVRRSAAGLPAMR